MNTQPVRTLPLAPTVLSKLEAAGFSVCSDLVSIGPVDLANEAGISLEEAQSCIRLATRGLDGAQGSLPAAVSARDLLAKEQERRVFPVLSVVSRCIYTFCAELDGLLGGGVAPGEVTEFCGAPGIGKTQLGIQLSVAVQLPAEFSGLAGEAVYIDTEGSFMVDRVVEMADACARHIRHIAAGQADPAPQRAAAAFHRDSILRGIHYFRAQNATEQRAVLENLPQFCAARAAAGGRVRLVVLDSVAFHFRQDFEDMFLRSRLLAAMNGILMKLADTHGLAVVVMNQVTTKVVPGEGARMVPALGESYAHSCTTRVMLTWDQSGDRAAELSKSPRLAQGRVNFQITSDGVRSIRSHKRSASGRQQGGGCGGGGSSAAGGGGAAGDGQEQQQYY